MADAVPFLPPSQQDPFWAADPAVLFRRDRLGDFYPAPHLPHAQQLNAALRLAVYGALLSCLVFRSVKFLAVPVVVALATLVLTKENYQDYKF